MRQKKEEKHTVAEKGNVLTLTERKEKKNVTLSGRRDAKKKGGER